LAHFFSRARVFVHGYVRAEELAKRRRARSVGHTGLVVEGHRAGLPLEAPW
jgi:hypothetical protein